MDDRNLDLAKELVDGAYIEQGKQGRQRIYKATRMLLSNRCIPEEGWSETM
jgi:hypothetical protein